MINTKITREDLSHAKPNCASCGFGIDVRDYEDNGNFCKRCCAMAGSLARARIGQNKQYIRRSIDMVLDQYDRKDLMGKECMYADISCLFG